MQRWDWIDQGLVSWDQKGLLRQIDQSSGPAILRLAIEIDNEG